MDCLPHGNSHPKPRFAVLTEALDHISHRLARAELFAAGSFMAFIFLLLLINIITRLNSNSLYWIDEAAVTSMVWMALLSASAGMHYRSAIAITLLKDKLSQHNQHRLQLAVDLVLISFFSFFLYLLFVIFDPYGLIIMHGVDLNAFSSTEFNFLYEEPTMTLGIKKYWTWLILPIFCIGSLIHCVANVLKSIQSLLLKGGRHGSC